MIDAFEVWLPYCGAGPDPSDWLGRWNFDLALIAAVGALLVLGHFRSKGTARFQWAAALVVMVLFVSPLCALGSALFAFRVGHHLVLALVLAPLLALAIPRAEYMAKISLPLATAAQAAVFWAWHVPAIYGAALGSDALFWTMQISITGSAMLWWMALRHASPLAGTASLLGTMVQMGLLGALIVSAGRPLYAPHWLTTSAWGLSPLEDQQLAGLVMWVGGGGAYLGIAAVMLYRALGPSSARQTA